jgi:hydroxymethylbilane synthase
MNKHVIIGSRGSDLALWQAHYTQRQLEQLGFTVEIRIIKTQGDKIQHLSFDKLEGKGFFTKELEDALLEGSIDLAVHSHKDLPTTSPEGLTVGAVSYREDCSESLLIQPDANDPLLPLGLKKGAIVGTSSLRRKSQLQEMRPDLVLRDLRGNVPTRVKKLMDGEYDAIVLASAGLNRLNLALNPLIRSILPPHRFIPAPAQGVLAFQIRESDARMQNIVDQLNDPGVAASIFAERRILNQLDGGCQLPLGVYCEATQRGYRLWASLQPLDGSPFRRVYTESLHPEQLAEKALLALRRRTSRHIYISRDPEESPLFISRMNKLGYTVSAINPIEYISVEVPVIPYVEWIFFSSKRTVEHFFQQNLSIPANTRLAALGSGTAAALHQEGYQPDFVGSDGATRDTALLFLELARGKDVLFPVSSESLRTVQKVIEEHANVHEVMVYTPKPRQISVPPEAEVFVFTSAGAVAAFHASCGLPSGQYVSIGRTTSEALRSFGLKYVHQAPFTTEESLSDLVSGL